jgi:hypothetical protein
LAAQQLGIVSKGNEMNSASLIKASNMIGKLVCHVTEPEIKGLCVAIEANISGGILFRVQWDKDNATWNYIEELQCV